MAGVLANDWIVRFLFAACVFVLTYLHVEKVIEWVRRRTIGSREEVMELLDRMLITIDKDKLSTSLLAASFGIGFIFFLVFWPNFLVGFLFGALMGVLTWSLPKIYLLRAWEARCTQITNQMVDGMTIMSNGVKAGLSITQSMERVVANMKGPLPAEMQLVLNKVQLGMSVEDALNEYGDRIPRPDVQMFVTSVNILKETGGNLAETFETIVNTVRERQKVEKRIEAMTAQGIMQGIILTLVPLALIIVFMFIDPNYIMPLFTKPLGWFALVIMLGLQIMGGVLIKKVVTIKV